MNDSKKEIRLIIFALLWVMCLPIIFFMINPDHGKKEVATPIAQVVSKTASTTQAKYLPLEPVTLSSGTLQLMEPTFASEKTAGRTGTIFAILYLSLLFVIFLRLSELYNLRQVNIQEEESK